MKSIGLERRTKSEQLVTFSTSVKELGIRESTVSSKNANRLNLTDLENPFSLSESAINFFFQSDFVHDHKFCESVLNVNGKNILKSLCEKCPNTEFFLVRIFPYSAQKKLRIWTLFTQ